VTASFPGESIDAHLGVLNITERQQAEIDRRRYNIADLLPYLQEEGIFTVVNHVASQVNGRLTPAHIASLLPWVDAFEVNNGSRLPSQNRTAAALAEAAGKMCVGGSDSHTGRGIGHTWTVVEGAHTREEFLDGLRAGSARAAGAEGNYFTMASEVSEHDEAASPRGSDRRRVRTGRVAGRRVADPLGRRNAAPDDRPGRVRRDDDGVERIRPLRDAAGRLRGRRGIRRPHGRSAAGPDVDSRRTSC
jgi:predicted metal-dependent phosphoesterase TrpH